METQRRPFTSLQPTLGCCFGSFPNVTPKQHCDLIARYKTNPKSLLELQLSKGQAELKQHTGETTEHCWAPWPRGHIQTLVTGSGAGVTAVLYGLKEAESSNNITTQPALIETLTFAHVGIFGGEAEVQTALKQRVMNTAPSQLHFPRFQDPH